jgi:hypothetical protein
VSDTSRVISVHVEVDGFESVREAEDHVARVLMADGCVLGVASGTPHAPTHWHMRSCDCDQPRVPDEDEREEATA